MIIDLNQSFTTDDVAILIASKDDSQHRQLRVTRAGEAYISDDVGNLNISDLAFRLETWDPHNGYTGTAAAADAGFVSRIERTLRDNWPNPSDTYIDEF